MSIAFFVGGCTKIISIPYPDYEKKVILTGILNPDSIISVQLFNTLPAVSNDSIFPPITNAKVLCYENNKLLGEMKYAQNGYYRLLKNKPQPLKKYRIEAMVNDLVVSAEDSVPSSMNYNAVITAPIPNSRNNNPEVIFDKASTTTPVYTWLFVGLYNSFYRRLQATSMASDSPFLDTFNANSDSNGKKAFSGEATRIKPEFMTALQFTFAPYNQLFRDSTLYVQVSTVSKNYDVYLKSSINAYQNRFTDKNGELNNPFFEPVKIYSNVKNGVGILGAIRVQRFALKNTKK